MNNTSNLTAKACQIVPGFDLFHQWLKQHVAISGKSDSLFTNYARHLARIALRFHDVPTKIDLESVRQYLYEVKQEFPSASEAYFKFTVYSLRYAYRMERMTDMHVAMPSIKNDKKLPVVLSKPEMRRLIATPKLQKHRLLLALLYGCGLRCNEVRNLKICHLDFERRLLHVKNGKGRRDRYVPLNLALIEQLKAYITRQHPKEYVFNGTPLARDATSKKWRYSQRGAQWVVKTAASKSGILKSVSVHTLRHTFATHLLEDGLDIVTIKELLGHSKIETTLVYLHVVQLERRRAFSPLDTLYDAPTDVVLEKSLGCPALAYFKEHWSASHLTRAW